MDFSIHRIEVVQCLFASDHTAFKTRGYYRPTRQIARLDGTSHQAVAKSFNLAIAKLKNFFDEQG